MLGQTIIEGWKPCPHSSGECRRCNCFQWRPNMKIHNCQCASPIHEACLMEEINQHRFAGSSHVLTSAQSSMLIFSCPRCSSPTLFNKDYSQRTVPFYHTQPQIQQYARYLYMLLWGLFAAMLSMWVVLILCGHSFATDHVKMCNMIMLGIMGCLWVVGWGIFVLKSRWRMRVFFRPTQEIAEESPTETEGSIAGRLNDTLGL